MTKPHTPREGKPQKPATDLADAPDGGKRWTQNAPLPLVAALDREATMNDRSRTAEVRMLLGEALAARRASRATTRAKKNDGATETSP